MATVATAKPEAATVLVDSPPEAQCYTFHGSVEMATPQHATIVLRALEVDPELRPDQVTKRLSVQGNVLHMNFAATELRMLRGAVGNCYDMLALAVRTIEQFGDSKAR